MLVFLIAYYFLRVNLANAGWMLLHPGQVLRPVGLSYHFRLLDSILLTEFFHFCRI